MFRIAVVDDEKNFVNFLSENLTDEGFSVETFYDGNSFVNFLKNNDVDIVLLDLNLPDCHGLSLYNKIVESNKLAQVIVITAHGDVNSAIEAVKMGCYDYITKPFDLDEIVLIVKRAIEKKKILEELIFHREKEYLSVEKDTFIGESNKIKELKKLLNILSNTDDVTILIRGESGTGKNLFARLIHNNSKRKENPFIEVNCASIPEKLFESELFGFEKGSFTDAKQSKKGLVELADKGTLFLDEIAEIPFDSQAKLLTFIESKRYRRVGSTKEFEIDVRIIASTNRDLEDLVRKKKFREDLYYRLNVIDITIPPLRERGDDLLILFEHFLKVYNKKYGKNLVFTKEIVDMLKEYDWPGNVRELKNVIERAVILSTGSIISKDKLILNCLNNENSFVKNENKMNLESIEKENIIKALQKTNYNKTKAAEILGISRYALLRKLKKYHLSDE